MRSRLDGVREGNVKEVGAGVRLVEGVGGVGGRDPREAGGG